MDEVTVTKYAKKIYGFAYSRTKNAADAEDLSQTILLELFRIDIRAEDLADPDGYVWRVCRYAWSNYYRRNKKYWEGCDLSEIPDMPTEEPTLEERVIENELYAMLRRKIMNLSETRRRITILFYYENRTGDEIARLLDIPPAMVRWHLAESRKLLKEQMEMNETVYVPKKLKVYFCGNANNGALAGLRDDLLVQNICIACAKKALTVEEICAEIGAAAAYVEDKLGALLDMCYLRKTANRYRTTFFIRDAAFVCKVKAMEMQLLAPLADALYDAVTAHLDQLREIGFAGCDLNDNLLLWDFITVAAHDYMNEYSLPTGDKTPLRGDGSRHWIDASWSAKDIEAECTEIDAALFDYIRFSGGCAGKHIGTENACMQQFDPPVVCGDRDTGSGLAEQLAAAAHQAVNGLNTDTYFTLMLTRAIENGMAEMVDGSVHMLVPCFTAEQFCAYRTLMETVILPEAAAVCGTDLAQKYLAVVKKYLPADLDAAEKEFVASRFYMPNAVPYLLYRAGRLAMPSECERNTVGIILWDR